MLSGWSLKWGRSEEGNDLLRIESCRVLLSWSMLSGWSLKWGRDLYNLLRWLVDLGNHVQLPLPPDLLAVLAWLQIHSNEDLTRRLILPKEIRVQLVWFPASFDFLVHGEVHCMLLKLGLDECLVMAEGANERDLVHCAVFLQHMKPSWHLLPDVRTTRLRAGICHPSPDIFRVFIMLKSRDNALCPAILDLNLSICLYLLVAFLP